MLSRYFTWLVSFVALSCSGFNCSSALDSAGSSSSSPSSAEEITLLSCETSLADDAPDFFKNYYKCVAITKSSDTTTIQTEDLPPHRSYYYGASHPNYEDFDYSRGDEYAPNPNNIGEQNIQIAIPDDPTAKGLPMITEAMVDGVVGTNDEEYPMGPAGIALDGVAIFNPLAAPGDDIDEERFVFDGYDAHPTEDDIYHYHTTSSGPLEVLAALGLTTEATPGSADVELYGIMCDGTVVLGCTELDGTVPESGDFDAQNGHVHDVVDGNDVTLFSSRYHTHICASLYTGYLYTPEIQYYEDCTVR